MKIFMNLQTALLLLLLLGLSMLSYQVSSQETVEEGMIQAAEEGDPTDENAVNQFVVTTDEGPDEYPDEDSSIEFGHEDEMDEANDDFTNDTFESGEMDDGDDDFTNDTFSGEMDDGDDDFANDTMSGKATCRNNRCSKYGGTCGRWTSRSACKYIWSSSAYCSRSSSSCRCCIRCGGSCGSGGTCRASRCLSNEVKVGKCTGFNCVCCKRAVCYGKCAGGCGACKTSCSSNEDTLSHRCGTSSSCKCCKPKQSCGGRCGGSCGGYCRKNCYSFEDQITSHCNGYGCKCCRRKDACSGRCGYKNRYYCRNNCPSSRRVSGTCKGSHCNCCRI